MWLGCETDTLGIAQCQAAVCMIAEGNVFGVQCFLARQENKRV